MGLFVYTQKGSIISMVDLPTTEIIEPFFVRQYSIFGYWYVKSLFYKWLFQQYTISKEGIKEVVYGSHGRKPI
jgi:hypothetical protein